MPLVSMPPPPVLDGAADAPGADGARAFVAGRYIEAPGFAVPVVDTTGAGDVFHGAFLLAMLEREAGRKPTPEAVTEALRFANAAAALKCRALGGRAGIPRRAEVDRFLTERG